MRPPFFDCESASAAPGWSTDCIRHVDESVVAPLWNGCIYATTPVLGHTGHGNQLRDYWTLRTNPELIQSGTATTDPLWTFSLQDHDRTTPGHAIQFTDHSSTGSHFGKLDHPALNVADSISLAIWVRLQNPGDGRSNHVINRKNSNPGTVSLFKHGSLSAWAFGLRDTSGTTQAVIDPDTATGGWHVIVASYDRQTQSLYVDGRLKASAAGTFAIDTSPYGGTWIGAHPTLPDANSFVGWLGLAAIWNRCLTLAEVRLLSDDPRILFQKKGQMAALPFESASDGGELKKRLLTQSLFVGAF